MAAYFKIGKLVAAFGVQGDIVLKHTLGEATTLPGLTVVFTEDRKSSFLPWFIEAIKSKTDDEVIIKLETINTREAALRLVKKEIWVTEADFKKFASKKTPASLLGFVVMDEGKDLGEVLEVIEQPQQLICRLEIDGREVLVPLNEGTLKKIDRRKKQILVSLPDGLLDIYLK